MTTNYKMIGKLDSGLWVSWNTINSPDYSGALYTSGGNLIPATIQVSVNYLNISDYNYKMIGKLESGVWVAWISISAPDYIGTYYTGGGTLLISTIQVSERTIITTIPFVNTYSLLFGANKYVDMGNILDFDIDNYFSVSCWFKTTDNSAEQKIWAKQATPAPWRGYALEMLSGGVLCLDLCNTLSSNSIRVTSAGGWNDGNWHHVVCTYNGLGKASGAKIYVDGNLLSVTTVYNNLTDTLSNSGTFRLGMIYSTSYDFNGNIDEVSIYNKELLLSEVQAIYNNGTPTNIKSLSLATNLLNWWRCGDGDTYPIILDYISDYQFPTIPDESMNEYDGTATNMEVSDIQLESPGSQALVFETSEYVNCGNVLNYEYNQPFSFVFWIKTTTISDYIFAKMEGSGNYRGYGCYILSSGKLHILLINVDGSNKIDVDTTTVINNNRWRHIVITYDGYGIAAGVKCYIDGISDTMTVNFDTLASGSITNSINFNISGRTNGSLTLAGRLGDFSVWNKELSLTEVSEIYNKKVPINLTTASCAADLAAWWRCGEKFSLSASGVPDFSGNGLHGTQVNMEITDVVSRTNMGNSMAFDGTNKYIKMGDVLGFEYNQSFSVSAWFKTTTTASKYILSKRGDSPFLPGYGLAFKGDLSGCLEWGLTSVTATADCVVRTTSTGWNNGAWHHVVATYNGSSLVSGMTIIIDGVLQTLTTVYNTLGTNSILTTAEFNIATRTNGASSLFLGSIDEVSVWNKVLSIGEATTIYNVGIPINLTGSSNLVGYWRMGDGIGFSGTMTNMEVGDITTDVP